MTEIRTVGVLGCGLMGSGIAQTAAVAGYNVLVHDADPAAWTRARGEIERSLAKFVDKEKLTSAECDAALARLQFVERIDALAGCDLVVEAVPEDLSLKNRLWAELDTLASPRTIFATNTSSLPIAAMAAATSRPDRFVGLHFFSPVPLMPLVEVVRGVATSEQTMQAAVEYARRLGKEPVLTGDTPGFIVNLLLIPYLLDAIRAVEQNVASIADVDTAMRLGAGYPMGPLTLLDFVGLDVIEKAAESLYHEFGEARYAPPPLLRRLVSSGWLGRKAGRGFYDYAAEPPVPLTWGAR